MVDVTFNPTEIQEGQNLCVKVQSLPMNHVMVPGSRRLTFTFENGNTKSYHQNNLKSAIFKQITHKFNGEVYRDLNEAVYWSAMRIDRAKPLGWERSSRA